MIEKQVKALMQAGNKSSTRGWSMQNILTMVEPSKVSEARKHILLLCGIDNEEKYIDKNLKALEEEKKSNYKELMLLELSSNK